MRRGVPWLVLGTCLWGPGCGGDDSSSVDAAGPDANGSDAASTDAGLDDLPWTDVEVVGEVSDPTAADDDPVLTPDLLELYFNSDRGAGNYDIWMATRASATEPWDTPQLVPGINGADLELSVELSDDGLTMIVSSRRSGGLGGDDLWLATRQDLGDPWGALVAEPSLNTSANEYGGALRADGLEIFFWSDRDGGYDIYRATRVSTGEAWATPEAVAELNSAAEEKDQFLDAEGLRIYFCSSRDGNHALYTATRPALDQPFGAVGRIAELDTTAYEDDPWVSGDRRVMYYTSGTMGSNDIFRARR